MDQSARAERFRKLHEGPDVLVLPNAWDAASAAIMADAGAKAVATSSAAVAWSLGYADGDVAPISAVCGVIAAASKAVDVPVSADIEGGFTDDLDELAANIRAVIAAGAVGINLEDGTRSPDLHARKIETVRKAATAAGVALFINARTDIYLKGLAQGDDALAQTLKRAELYRAAGADGIFVPGPGDPALIRTLATEIKLPLNVMGWIGVPKASELAPLGVRRLSTATNPFRVAYAALAKSMAQLMADGDPDALAKAGDGFPNLQKRFG
jgi:2-methylisocitrate lyase-like PEP mutase family enzyme